MRKLILIIFSIFLVTISFAEEFSFTGDRFEEGVYLQWQNTEDVCEKYLIKRSRDGKNFEQIGTIDFDANEKEYQFVDWLLFSNKGVISYQLYLLKDKKEVKVASFFVEDVYERTIDITPNPTIQGYIKVSISGIVHEQGMIDVYTPMGEVIYTNSFELLSNKEIQLIDTKNFNYRTNLFLRVRMENSVKIIRLLF